TFSPNAGAVTPIINEGDVAPGTDSMVWGLSQNNFPSINNQNEALFSGSIVGNTPGTIVFTHKPGAGLRKVVATGDAAPGGGTFQSPSTGGSTLTRINSAGQVALMRVRVEPPVDGL